MHLKSCLQYGDQFVLPQCVKEILFSSPALELQPDDALVLKRRADVRGKLSMKAEAVKDYQKAIKIQTMRHK